MYRGPGHGPGLAAGDCKPRWCGSGARYCLGITLTIFISDNPDHWSAASFALLKATVLHPIVGMVILNSQISALSLMHPRFSALAALLPRLSALLVRPSRVLSNFCAAGGLMSKLRPLSLPPAAPNSSRTLHLSYSCIHPTPDPSSSLLIHLKFISPDVRYVTVRYGTVTVP